MAKRIATRTFLTLTDDTRWREEVSHISNGLEAVGLIRVTGAGVGVTNQINLATTTVPSSGGFNGYEVRYLNDSLHATSPVYVRIEYGRSATHGVMNLNVTFGTGFNSASATGLLTGVVTTTLNITRNIAAASLNTSALPTYFACDEGYAWMALYPNIIADATIGSFIIARTTDASGNITGDGVAIYYTANTGANTRVTIDYNNSLLRVANKAYTMVYNDATGTNSGSGPAIFRHYTSTTGLHNIRHVATYINAEIGKGSVQPLNLLGGTIDYIAIGTDISSFSLNGTFTHCPMLAWTGADV